MPRFGTGEFDAAQRLGRLEHARVAVTSHVREPRQNDRNIRLQPLMREREFTAHCPDHGALSAIGFPNQLQAVVSLQLFKTAVEMPDDLHPAPLHRRDGSELR